MSTADTLSSQPDAIPLRNAVSIFLAHFHVRRGNELLWSKGDADLKGVEWKVLPSGSHALESDVIYFETDSAPNGNRRIGVAAFRNRKVDREERSSAALQDDDDQRGARMISVGAILDCGKMATPWSQLAATLPHLLQLENLAGALSADPSCRNLLEEWLQAHKLGNEEFKTTIGRDLEAANSLYAHDPLFQLPAISNALGPLLPSILKRILLPSYRLLIYIPGGSPTHRAAEIAFALGELACAACQSQQVGGTCPVTGNSPDQHGLYIRGLVGLHDIAKLQDEAKKVNSHGQTPISWIAWTADKILIEKHQLFDALLDLSPMVTTTSHPSDFLLSPTVLPHLFCSQQSKSSDVRAKGKTELKKQTWTTREFAVFRGLDEQASVSAVTRRGRRRSSLSHRTSQVTLQESATSSLHRSQVERSPTKHLNRQRTTSTFLAFLRFWLSNWWILPYQWRINLRNSYGYVPLSIRGDGGVRASIMLLPGDDDDDDDDDEGDDYDNSDEDSVEGDRRSSHQSLNVPTDGRPELRRGLSEEALDLSPEEEDDPILAACGATQASIRRRKSRSFPSSAAQHLADTVAHQIDADGRPISPLSIIKVSSTRTLDQGQEDDIVKDAKESVKLSISIFETWSLWVKELVIGVQDMLEDRLAKERDDRGGVEETLRLQEEETSLLQNKKKPILLTSQQVSELSLSVGNQVDVDLILYLASTVTDREVDFARTWWSLTTCLWS